MATFAQGGPSIASKLFNLKSAAVQTLFNPYQSKNLWRCKQIEVIIPPTKLSGGVADVKIFFPKDEFLEKCWITRIDYVNTYFNTGVELSPQRNLLFYGPFSMYLNVLRGQEIIIDQMPLQFCQFEGKNSVFRNAYPFRMEMERSYIQLKSYDATINTLLETTQQSLLFNVWYIPVEAEVEQQEIFQSPRFKFNPYKDQNWFRLKFGTTRIIGDPGNALTAGTTVKCPIPYDRYLDQHLVNRIVSLDPTALGPVSPTSAGWRIGPNNETFYNEQISAYLTVVDKNAVVLDNAVMEYFSETNENGGFRNLIPFNIDTARTYINVASRASTDPTGNYLMLGYYYLPKWLGERLLS